MHPEQWRTLAATAIVSWLIVAKSLMLLTAWPGLAQAQWELVQAPTLYWLALFVLGALLLALISLNRRLAGARRRIEQEVQRRDRLLAELPVGVYELADVPGAPLRFEFASDRAQHLVGVTRAEMEADFSAAFRHFHPLDRDRVVAINEQARASGQPFEASVRILDGESTRWIQIQSRPRPANGHRRWAGIIRDVTEQKSIEQALAEKDYLLSSMSRLSNTGGWELDVATGAVRWTEQTFLIHELPLSDQPPLEQSLAFYQAEDREQLEQALARAIDQGEGFDLTLRMTTAKGREIVTHSLCQPLVEDGQVVRLIGAFQDVTDLVEQERKAREAEHRFRSILEQAPIAILLHNAETADILDGNAEACSLFGAASLGEMIEKHDQLWSDSPFSAREARARIRQAMAEGRQQFEWCSTRLDGEQIWLQVTLTPIRLDDQDCVLTVCIDISQRRQTERLLEQRDERFRTLLKEVPGVAIQGFDLDGTVNYWNQASENLYGYTEQEAIGANLLDLIIPPELREGVQASIAEVARGGSIENGELELVRKDGARVPVYSSHTAIRRPGLPTELFCIDIDLSERKRHENELLRIASYDALTGLPNRNLLAELMREHCARTDRSGEGFALCYLDLDEFKPINDQFGHQVGDQVLIRIGQRLRDTVRGSDVVGRLGGDEFVLLLSGVSKGMELERRLRSLLDQVSAPILVEHLKLQVTASLGVTVYPDDAVDPDILLRHADQAMYRAKSLGRNSYSLFDLGMAEELQRRRERLGEIARAMENRQFELYFHPKICLSSGEVRGVEGLIRWQHPDQGLLSPASFLSDLEQSDLESVFGDHVIELALQQLARWIEQDLVLPISVNIAGPHLLGRNFVLNLSAALQRHPQVPPGLFQLEILETAAVADLDQAIEVLQGVRTLGVAISLDDFGTGYSSLSHLRSLPVDEVKIDQSFVRDMLNDSADYNIVRSVIGLARAFNLRVVAEGVETMAHSRALMALECGLGQGYAFALPMPAAELPGWLGQWRGQAADLFGVQPALRVTPK
ncbi:MAG: EAL domain-containing protein [Wenzhouxiangella sp.]